MLVGKRGGPIIRRTSSMSGGMNIEIPDIEIQEEASDPMTTMTHHHQEPRSMVSPRNSINKSMDTTPHFLRTCRLCNSRLAPGRDIYMYRGDTAFCSLECREEQMKQDERKDKWKNNNKVAAKKQQDPPPTSSTKTQTLAAA